MFTIKFYSDDSSRTRIYSAESFTILRSGGEAEITLHQKNQGEDARIDICPAGADRAEGWPPVYQKAIIENGDYNLDKAPPTVRYG